MHIERQNIHDVILITPEKFADERGFFSETYKANAFERLGLQTTFVQDNHSLSCKRGTVRGLHFQIPPLDQVKLVRVVRGAILDVCVDIRVGSPSFGQHVSVVLSEENWSQVLVPSGFAHGFAAVSSNTEVVYKTSAYYSPEHERGVLWSDPDLMIDWQLGDVKPTLSEKDQRQPRLRDIPRYFSYR